MAFSSHRRLRLEQLETRYVPSTVETLTVPPPPPTAPAQSVIDPTLDSSNPTGTNVQVTIVAVGQPAPGSQNVTVTGLTEANLQGGASIQFVIGGSTYNVNSYQLNQDGTCRLTLLSDSNLASLLANHTTATVVLGGGGNTTPTEPPPPPSSGPIIDPTLDPQG